MKTKDKPTSAEIIERLGGTVAVAKLCRVKSPSVSFWKRNGIPPARLQFLQLLKPNVFRPRRKKVAVAAA